jgi:hypothetical protein
MLAGRQSFPEVKQHQSTLTMQVESPSTGTCQLRPERFRRLSVEKQSHDFRRSVLSLELPLSDGVIPEVKADSATLSLNAANTKASRLRQMSVSANVDLATVVVQGLQGETHLTLLGCSLT